jgi:alginate O-acetyltransferase complex protein AlgI
MLLLASYVFYGAWDWRFLFLLFGSTVIDFFVAQQLDKTESVRRRKCLLGVSLVVNLGALGFFKYFHFFTGEMVTLLQQMGWQVNPGTLDIILPVGISFYTFQTLSYTIDVYRRQRKHVDGFLDFALYVSFFPQLVAGPIERSSRLLPQICNERTRQEGDFAQGCYLVILGLFKKVIIADTMANIVNGLFSVSTAELTGTDCLVAVYAFALQIYCDFSGYSAIARGVSKWMGFDLMVNFDTPYFAITPSEFWQRWHISLSSWLRDYLYIPLGGNRGGRLMTYRNLMLTMVLGGLWHGAGWTFLVWGAFHGLILCAYRPITGWIKGVRWPGKFILGLVMFHLVCISWLLFRAESMSQAWAMFVRIVTDMRWSVLSTYTLGMIVVFAGPLLVFEYWLYRKGDLLALLKKHWLIRGLVYAYAIVTLWMLPPGAVHEFIYFQF